jgi:nucleoside-diphosphate-sugar epimerase
MKVGVIGYTGFVGSTITRLSSAKWLYNSKNIAEIRNETFDLLINAGVSSLKWKANRDPKEDQENIEKLQNSLERVSTDRFVQISTIDVMPANQSNNEDTVIDESLLQPNGLHRLELERWISNKFPHTLIVRLPHLFGPGLKKNFIFDLIHANALALTDYRDIFQFYNVNYLWQDLSYFLGQDCSVINFTSEPMTASEIAAACFGTEFTNRCDRQPIAYDVRSKWRYRSSQVGGYMYTKEETIRDISAFRRNYAA